MQLEKITTKEENQALENEQIKKRALEELGDLGLTWDFLIGKTILDVGAGAAAIARAAKEKETKIISLDRNSQSWIQNTANIPDAPYVEADARQLPFQDETFDLVVSHAGPIVITPDKEDVVTLLRESLRVLKNNGEFRFGPGSLNANLFSNEELFTPEEEKLFTTQQRIERIRERSIDFLKTLNPNIQQELIQNPTNQLSTIFYAVKKSRLDNEK